MHPTEWDSVNRHFELFADAKAYLDEIFRILEEGTLDDVDLDALEGEAEWDFTYGFFIDAFAEALTTLRSEGRFAAPRFEADVLLGTLFGDPGKHDLRVIEGVSRKVNSPMWHAQVEKYCELAKT